jgi:hypothetical protein
MSDTEPRATAPPAEAGPHRAASRRIRYERSRAVCLTHRLVGERPLKRPALCLTRSVGRNFDPARRRASDGCMLMRIEEGNGAIACVRAEESGRLAVTASRDLCQSWRQNGHNDATSQVGVLHWPLIRRLPQRPTSTR